MTVHCLIQAMLRRGDFNAPGCIQEGPVPLDTRRPVVYVVSFMTFVNRAFPQRVDHKKCARQDEIMPSAPIDMEDINEEKGTRTVTLTMEQIYGKLSAPVKSLFLGGQAKHIQSYILTADKRSYLPKEKDKTRKKRRTKLDLYPKNTELTQRGLALPGDQTEYGIQIHRLMASGHQLRTRFFERFVERMKADATLHQCKLIVDMLEEAPFALYGGSIRSQPDCATEIGEDDILMFEWASQWSDQADIVFQSIDRDTLLTALLHVDEFKNRVYCDFGDGLHVDVKQMASNLIKAGWTIDAFVQTAIFCGTDFVEKNTLANQISIDDMFAATFALLQCTPFTDLLFCHPTALNFWLRLLYAKKHGRSTVESASSLRTHKKAKFGMPTREAIELGRKEATWNYHYWKSLQFTRYEWPPKGSAPPGELRSA